LKMDSNYFAFLNLFRILEAVRNHRGEEVRKVEDIPLGDSLPIPLCKG